jgi:hypothetical protein
VLTKVALLFDTLNGTFRGKGSDGTSVMGGTSHAISCEEMNLTVFEKRSPNLQDNVDKERKFSP